MFTIHNINDNNKLNNSIITIGNYDGIHLGHKYIISEILKHSKKYNLPMVLITFDPHTNKVIFPNYNNEILLTFNEKS